MAMLLCLQVFEGGIASTLLDRRRQALKGLGGLLRCSAGGCEEQKGEAGQVEERMVQIQCQGATAK